MHCILVYISCDISAIRNQDNDGSLGSIHPMVQAMTTPKKSYSRSISRACTTTKFPGKLLSLNLKTSVRIICLLS